MKKLKSLVSLCAVILAITAFSIPVLAASIEDQMAANSAAWHIANAAGDTATCEALHAQNVALANQKAGSGGTASYNSSQGTWTITDSSGNTTKSSGTSNGKTNTITYTTVSSNGSVSSTSARSYTDSSINAYMNNGGTHEGLQNAYNNAAAKVTASGNYGSIESAASEVAVAKELLGLTDAEAAQLQKDLEASKQEYALAQSEYNAAVAAGDAEAAAAAKEKMNEAHDAAESTRAEYNYTGDAVDTVDGGYYYENGQKVYTSSYGGGGFFTPTTTNYKVTASCNDGGTITPYGENYVKRYGNITFEINAYDNAVIKRILVDGVDVADPPSRGNYTEDTYTFNYVRKAHTIQVVFEQFTFDIEASAGPGGSISPAGTVTVDRGEDQRFTITPNAGYVIDKVLVDGVDQGPVGSYTFQDVTEKHTISATFKEKTYDIVASAGTGGSISPAGTIQVTHGSSKTFTITPNSGFLVDDLLVDGISKGALTTYTFSNVTEAHTITASFKPEGSIGIDGINVTNDTGLSVVSGSIKSGYGIFADVDASYSGVTDVKLTMTYNFGQGLKTVILEEGTGGIFHFPENVDSPLDKRCVYIPVETPDGDYTLTFTLTAKDAAGSVLTETDTAIVRIRGNMYQDDFTGDS